MQFSSHHKSQSTLHFAVFGSLPGATWKYMIRTARQVCEKGSHRWRLVETEIWFHCLPEPCCIIDCPLFNISVCFLDGTT